MKGKEGLESHYESCKIIAAKTAIYGVTYVRVL